MSSDNIDLEDQNWLNKQTQNSANMQSANVMR